MILTADEIMGAIAYNAYRMAPDNAPRKIDVVMGKVKAYLREVFTQPFGQDNDFLCKDFEDSETFTFISDMLFSILEFREWALSQVEFEKIKSVYDENSEKFTFSHMHDTEDKDCWKTDFIDLNTFAERVCMIISERKSSHKKRFENA